MIATKLRQHGDTIIEVLIAIAVLSLVLGGAFSITNRTSSVIRDTQEHTEALKLAESQVEQLKQLGDKGGKDAANNSIFASGPGFCIKSGLILTACNFPSLGSYSYTVNTTVTTTASPNPKPYTFLVAISWPTALGGTGNVSLYYNMDH